MTPRHQPKGNGLGRLLVWLTAGLATLAFLVLAALPVGRDASAAVSIASVVVAFVLARFSERFWYARTITVLLLAFTTLRYFFWRIDGTVPPMDDLLNFIPGVILFVAELLTFCLFFVSLFVILDPINRKPVPLQGDPSEWPTVDVFIPSYNESADLLETTLAAAIALDYPTDRFRVHLLDDGGTDQKVNHSDPAAAAEALARRQTLMALCERLGAHYRTRAKNLHAKAGNINEAFHKTDGELILILDADHVPTVDFLRATVGFFQQDPGLFMVQTPHFFVNPDPVEYNLNTFERMPSENEMFYYSIQPGLDRWNASFFCGSAAVLRRTALEEVGGLAGETITEDCETALELHSRGWRSAYLAQPLIAGLQPETFASFIAQRSRWAQGMTQLFVLKNPLFKRGLTIPQRICYTSTMMYWFFWFWRPVFMLAPLCYAFFGLEIFRINLYDFMCFVLPHIFSAIFLSHMLHGRTRWPLFSELYEYVMSLHIARASISTLLNPRAPTFKVTAKGESVDRTGFSELALPFIGVVLLLGAGLGLCLWRYLQFPEHREAIAPVALWNLLSFLLAASGLAVVYERKRVRRQERMTLQRPGFLTFEDGTKAPVQITDLSAGGLGLTMEPRWRERLNQVGTPLLSTADPIDGQTLSTGLKILRIEARSGELVVGTGFVPRGREEVLTIARLVFGNSAGWESWIGRKRTNTPNLMLGFAYFFGRILPRSALALWAIVTTGFGYLGPRRAGKP
nr:UDP-forming cellulose synthase catalytic subunit [Azospirillum sp. SYSU D00513]